MVLFKEISTDQILSLKRIPKKMLQSLNGRLRFAARHIWCGEAFCRALEKRINKTKDNDYTRLTKQIRNHLKR